MDNKINGRTPEEIKMGLECYNCGECSYSSKNNNGDARCGNVESDALALIQQYENHIGELTEKVQQLERERDAIEDDFARMAKEVDDAFVCEFCSEHFPGYGCEVCDFQWIGARPESPKEDA